jgi:hypothetical protein
MARERSRRKSRHCSVRARIPTEGALWPSGAATWSESGAEIGRFLEIRCSAIDLGQDQRLATGNAMAPVRAPGETPQNGSGLALA